MADHYYATRIDGILNGFSCDVVLTDPADVAELTDAKVGDIVSTYHPAADIYRQWLIIEDGFIRHRGYGLIKRIGASASGRVIG